MEDKSPLLEDGEDDQEAEVDDKEFGDDIVSLGAQHRNPLETLDLDKLLTERLGQFGRYQKGIYFLVSLPAMLTAILTMASVFTVKVPEHRCQIPGCDNPDNLNYSAAVHFRDFSIPRTAKGEFDSCNRFLDLKNGTCSANSFNKSLVHCDKFVYDISVMKKTVTMKYNLVCDNEGKVDLSQSIYFGGVLAGASVFGQLGDLIGRKPVFMITLLQTLVCGLVTVFSPDLVLYDILQFLTAMGQVGLFQTCFVIGVELVGPKYRVFCGIVIEFFFVAGELILAFLAYYLRDWEKMTLFYMIPSFLFLSYYFVIPRSVRWLLANQRYLEAEAELQRVAKFNKVPPLTMHDFHMYAKESEEIEVKESFFDLLQRPRLVIRLLIVFLCWIVVTLVYYGLSLAASTLGGDVFLNFTLLSLAEFPGYAFSYLGMQYYGRKFTMICSLLVSGLACLVSGFLPKSMSTLHTLLFLLGKFGVTSAFGTVYLYTSELFPTSVRNLCLGLSSMTGRVGAIVAPYIKNLGEDSGQDWIPLAIFGVSGIISGCAVFFLQETRGKPLPRTLDEAEQR